MEDEKVIPQVDFAVEQHNEKVTKDNKKSFRKIFILYFFLCIIIITYCYFLLNWQAKKNNESKTEDAGILISLDPSKPNTPSNALEFKPVNSNETNVTKKARVLELPELYPGGIWEELQGKQIDDINEIWVYDDQIRIPITEGKWYRSESPLKLFSVENYYWKDLDQKGWVGVGNDDMYLHFNSFKLAGIIADGPCGGVTGSLGYKDGFIRLLTIKRSLNNCDPMGNQKINEPEEHTTNYIIFISGPIALDTIIKTLESKKVNPT